MADFFGLDDPWQRPRPALTRSDWIVAASFFVFAALGLELVRSYGLWTDAQPHWVAYTALATITIPLVFRRRHPLLVAGYAAVHMVVIGIAVPELSFQIAMQVAYFYAVYCAVAWSRERRRMLALLGRVVILTTFDRDDYLFDGLQAGASGFLLKNTDPEHLVEAVRATAHGHALLAPEVTLRVIRQATDAPAPVTPPRPRAQIPTSPTGRTSCSRPSPGGCPTPRSPPSCTSVRPRSRPTSATA